MGRGDLGDAEWERLRPVLPVSNGRCGRWRDHRQVIDGILHRVRAGVQRCDLPGCFEPWQTVCERHSPGPDPGVKRDQTDRTSGRDAVAGSRRPPGGGGAGGEGLGRSRGGSTSKPHLSADGRFRPLSTRYWKTRCFMAKNSCEPCVASPRPTTFAPPTMAPSARRSAVEPPGSVRHSGFAARSRERTTPAGDAGDAGDAGGAPGTKGGDGVAEATGAATAVAVSAP
ncbi:transposase [Streptomyces viridiviolaceus]|uniref:Transposase n=1 Tax=Streptomyces viridiviolaceus TaxID=68282 RepID=A0ABW2ED13_9ACTN